MTVTTMDAAGTANAVDPALGDGIDAVLVGSVLFGGVDPAAVAAVRPRYQSVEYVARQSIYLEGEFDDRLYVVTAGKVTLGRRCPDGRSLLMAVLGPSDVFGELSLWDPGPRTADATALTEVRAVAMDRDVLRGWLGSHPEVADRLLRALAARLRRTDDDRCDLVFTDVAGRVAKVLLRLAGRFGEPQSDGTWWVAHDLTQDEIAQLVGASRETVNKVLTEFTARGAIRAQVKSVLITDPEQLRRRAQPALPHDEDLDADVRGRGRGRPLLEALR